MTRIPRRVVIVVCLVLSTLVGALTPSARGSATTATTAWPLPGVTPLVSVTQADVVAGFARADLVQLEGNGVFYTSTDPLAQGHFEQGELLRVEGRSPSAGVEFASTAYFGRLEYEPYAASGLAPLGKPSSAFAKNYCLPATGANRCAQVGRATGILAVLVPQSIRSTDRGFKRSTDRDFGRAYGGTVSIRPPGYVSRLTQAGHLLGYELGGPVKNPRNFVAQLNLANAPSQSSLENGLKDVLTPTASSGGTPGPEWVFVRVTPMYQGSCVVPYEVHYEALGQNGWQLPTQARGIAAQWLKFEKDTDGTVIVVIRNAVKAGTRWLVPGQDPKATCVPAGYAG